MNGYIYIYIIKIKWKLFIDILKYGMLKVILVCFEYNFVKINRNCKVLLLVVCIYILMDKYCWFDFCIYMVYMLFVICLFGFFILWILLFIIINDIIM